MIVKYFGCLSLLLFISGCSSGSSDSQSNGEEALAEGPVAVAGEDQLVPLDSFIMLDAGFSESGNTSPLQYNWQFESKPFDSNAVMTVNEEFASFTTDVDGSYVASVTVVDGNGLVDVDPVVVSTQSNGSVTVSNAIGHSETTACGYQSGAAEVIDYQVGSPSSENTSQTPLKALGLPDYSLDGVDTGENRGFVTLGCSGQLSLRLPTGFVDGSGADLAVFEIGEMIEPTSIEISADCENWVPVEQLSGGLSRVDISGVAQDGVIYQCVRLTDLESSCVGNFPGAELDAVIALNCPLSEQGN